MAKGKLTIQSIGGVSLRRVKNPSGTESLLLDINRNGQRAREYLGVDFLLTGDREADAKKIRLAKAIATQRAHELRDAEYGLRSLTKRKSDFIEYFANLLLESDDDPDEQKGRRGEKKRKGKVWINTFKRLIKYTKGKPVQFGAITDEFVEGFRDYLLKELKPNSARTYYGIFCAALNIAVQRKIIIKNPASTVKSIPSHETIRDYLTADEVATLHNTDCLHDVIKRAFMWSCYTGMRLCDVKALKWNQIRVEGVQLVQKKTKGVLYLPLNTKAREYAGERGSDDQLVFDLPLNDEFTRRHLKIWVKQAGISKHISYHNSRHTFATLLVSADIGIYTIQKLLGHTKLEHTEIYSKMVSSVKQDAVNKIG